MNRPAELISQLRILGRLEDFGSGAQFGERFRGPDAYHRLHWHLRARCFARRLKADVLPQLPAKTRAVVPVELDNEPEYRLAEAGRDRVAAQPAARPARAGREGRGRAAGRAARAAERAQAARRTGQAPAALAWIHDFLTSGERLIVFARHREIQHAVRRALPGRAPHPRHATASAPATSRSAPSRPRTPATTS